MGTKSKLRPILITAAVLLLATVIIVAICNLPKNKTSFTSVDQLTQTRIQQIRQTPNTQITNRNGKIYYVSATGDDNNDGLSTTTPWQSLTKINQAFSQKNITDGDTILFNRGDEFRGNISVTACNILIGAYGDENKTKPQILISPYNGANTGEWEMVAENIWKYTVNGENPFLYDVGVIWFFKNGEAQFGQKITTTFDTDETQILPENLLAHDLEFYHYGHSSSHGATGKALYLYSVGNPKTRFDDIEFSLGKNGIRFGNYTDLHVDNIIIKFAGNHGIGGGTVANLKVTNCELGYIGGAMQYYKDDVRPVRFGNAIEIYGSVTKTKNYPVKDGFIVDNNYIYQVYDAGITFQVTTEKSSIMENAVFVNNIVERCNYNVEYWNTSTSLDPEVQAQTYIVNYKIDRNIMRFAGYGVSTTRPDKGNSCNIKTWTHSGDYDNRVVGSYQITNNIFDQPREQMFYIYTSEEKSLPQMMFNAFYGYKDIPFGYYYAAPTKTNYPFSRLKLMRSFPNNDFYDLDTLPNDCRGTSQDTQWTLNIASETLTISGNGAMADYTPDNLPEWYAYRTFISKIVIGENVTKLGKYAFYQLPYVETLEINAKNLENLSRANANDGDNYTFYQTGKAWSGINVIFGKTVTRIPAQIFWPAKNSNEAPNLASLQFKGNKIKEIGDHAFLNLHATEIIIPNGVEKIGTLAFSSADAKIIYLPNSVTQLDSWAFSGCKKVEKIVLSPNIKKIQPNTFRLTDSLQQLIIPGDVTYGSSNYTNLFSNTSNTTVYGNETVKKLVADYNQATQTNNIQFKTLEPTSCLTEKIYLAAQHKVSANQINYLLIISSLIAVSSVLVITLIFIKKHK